MRLFKISAISWLFVFAISFFASIDSVEAQRPWISKNRMNRFHRYTGNWFSDGYHVRNPGPYVGYYQPWSRHNTASFSRWQKGGTPTQHFFQDGNSIRQNDSIEIAPFETKIERQQQPNPEPRRFEPTPRNLLPEIRRDQPQDNSSLIPIRSRTFRLRPPTKSR